MYMAVNEGAQVEELVGLVMMMGCEDRVGKVWTWFPRVASHTSIAQIGYSVASVQILRRKSRQCTAQRTDGLLTISNDNDEDDGIMARIE